VSIFLAHGSKHLDRQKVLILSPSETVIEVHRKALEYLAGGNQEVRHLDHVNGEVFVKTEAGIRLLPGAAAVLECSLLPVWPLR
jgi:hypothetical protein